MAEKLTFRYDPVGDIFYISKCPAYVEQESEELVDEVIARLNPTTGEVEALEILFFSRRLTNNLSLDLPLVANLHLVASQRACWFSHMVTMWL